jgi:hypothetical protein
MTSVGVLTEPFVAPTAEAVGPWLNEMIRVIKRYARGAATAAHASACPYFEESCLRSGKANLSRRSFFRRRNRCSLFRCNRHSSAPSINPIASSGDRCRGLPKRLPRINIVNSDLSDNANSGPGL